MTEYGETLTKLSDTDPITDVRFQRSVSKECDCCGVVTETFVMSVDGETFERLCWQGFLATTAGERTPGGKAIGAVA
jgi:hypothetical protein